MCRFQAEFSQSLKKDKKKVDPIRIGQSVERQIAELIGSRSSARYNLVQGRLPPQLAVLCGCKHRLAPQPHR